MSITRLFNYLPGSLAKGEEVSAEYDSIIAFVNGLELSKLNSSGGTVSNLTVSGAFVTGGANTFNGSSVFNANVSFASSADLSLGVGSVLNITADGAITKGIINFLAGEGEINFPSAGVISKINFPGGGGVVLSTSSRITSPEMTLTDNSFSFLQNSSSITIGNGATHDQTVITNHKVSLYNIGQTKFFEALIGATYLEIMMKNLPIADPLISGRVWSNAGVLTVSP